MKAARQFGSMSGPIVKAAQDAGFHPDNLYMVVMDNPAMWDPATLDAIVKEFPKRLLTKNELYLLLVECVANAAVHAKAEALVFFARRRKKVLLLSFYQSPPMGEEVLSVLEKARAGVLPDYVFDLPGGLGFPILLRVAESVTITSDRTRLQLWFRV
jgi:hypothetical protein